MNNEGPSHALCPTGFVRDVILQSLNGQLIILDSTIASWVTLPNTEAYYSRGSSGIGETRKAAEMIRDALNTFDAGFDFRRRWRWIH